MIMRAFHRANSNFPEGGTCLEFGVCSGMTYMQQAIAIRNQYPNSKLIGFDSWEGLPEEEEGVWRPDRHAAGQFSCRKDAVLGAMAAHNISEDPRFKFVDGFYSDSLTPSLQSEIKNLIFVNVDVDLYLSCKEVLEFIKPLLRPGVVIYFDDWKDPQDKYEGKWGEHLAWEEFIIKYPEIKYDILEINQYNQRYIIIL